MEQVCITGVEQYAIYGTIVVTLASALANVVSDKTFVGKIVKFLAVNIKLEKK